MAEVCPFCQKSFKRLKSHLPHCKSAPATKAAHSSKTPPVAADLPEDDTGMKTLSSPLLTSSPSVKTAKRSKTSSTKQTEKPSSSTTPIPATTKIKRKLRDEIKTTTLSSSLSPSPSLTTSPSSITKPQKKSMRAQIQSSQSKPVSETQEGTKASSLSLPLSPGLRLAPDIVFSRPPSVMDGLSSPDLSFSESESKAQTTDHAKKHLITIEPKDATTTREWQGEKAWTTKPSPQTIKLESIREVLSRKGMEGLKRPGIGQTRPTLHGSDSHYSKKFTLNHNIETTTNIDQTLSLPAPVANPPISAHVANPVLSAPVANPVILAPVANPVISAPVANPVISAPVANPVISAHVANSVISAPVANPVLSAPAAKLVMSAPVANPVISAPAAKLVMSAPVANPVLSAHMVNPALPTSNSLHASMLLLTRTDKGAVGAVSKQTLGEVRLRKLPGWLADRCPTTPREGVGILHKGWQWYYRKYIDVKKGGVGGVAMLLTGYCVLSYMWSYPHIKRDRWRRYH